MRKDSGSLIATRDGIFAASRFLRHRDIAVAAAHYADKKTAIDVGALLEAAPWRRQSTFSLIQKEEDGTDVPNAGPAFPI